MKNATEPRSKFLVRCLPISRWLPHYERSWLSSDLVAGLTIVALLVPEGMAYAQMAGVPPQTAFYAAPIGLLAYAVFGSSRQLVVAVSSVIATMSFATVSLIAEPDSPDFIVLTAALALLAGVVSVVAGLLKMGRVAQFFSASVLVGFVTGLALLIIVKQLPKLLGIEGGEGNAWQRLYEVVVHLPEAHLPTLVTGVLCLILLVVLEHFYHRIPAALVALVFGIAFSAVLGLEGRGVEVVGEIPSGLAAPSWPDVTLNEWWLLLPGAMGLALVNFAEAIGPSRSFASAHRYEISADQELIGLGTANVGAGLFQGFPIGSSLSKSAANDRAGAHCQMSGIIAAAVTAVVALFFTQWFTALPEATLGAIVVVAVSGMVKVAKMKHLYRVRRTDFALALVALLAVLTVETLEALLIAVIVSLLALVWRVSQPRLAVLGREPDALVFSDVGRHPENTTVPGLLIVRPENGLFFANAEGIAEAILGETRSGAEPVRAVLVDLGATTDLDVPSADVLARMAEELSGRDVRLMLTRVITPVREMMERAGVLEEIGPEDVFVRPPEAILDYLSSQYDADGVQELLRSAVIRVRVLLQAHLSKVPVERQVALAEIVEDLDRAIEQSKV